MSVPVDYGRPHDSTTTVALARIKAADPPRRWGALMLDPGGSGQWSAGHHTRPSPSTAHGCDRPAPASGTATKVSAYAAE